MLIALINPPYKADTYYDSGYCCLHLGLAYIASALEHNGHKVDIYECGLNDISTKEIIKILTDKNYDAIGFTTYYFNIMQVYRIAQKVKKSKQVFTFVGGIFSSMNFQEILERGFIDCCALGEGEETVVDLMECIGNNGDLSAVDGIAYRVDDKTFLTKKRQCIADLDKLSFPKRTYFFKGNITSMIASRGCNGNCSFCGIINYYKQYTTRSIRIRSPRNVVDEMEFLAANYKVNYVYFQDENLFATTLKNQNWIIDFCSEIKKRQLDIKFYAYARADDILNHKHEVALLKDAGLDCVFVGIESFVERQLKLYDKRTLPKTNIELLEFVKEMQLNINVGFILFDPYLTIDEFKCNVENLMLSKFYENCYFSQSPISCLGPLYPMPYTKFYDELIELNMYDDSIFHKYKFIDENIQMLYENLDKWKKMVSLKYTEIDSEYKLVKPRDDNGFKDCLDRLRSLLKMDIEFLNEFAAIDLNSEDKREEIFSKYRVGLEII